MSLKPLLLLLLPALLLTLNLSACDTSSTTAQPPPATSPPPAAAPLAKVEVPKEGKKFEPPVELEQLPEGAWICDMGTVHYARGEKGDGKCPECGMMLKEHKH